MKLLTQSIKAVAELYYQDCFARGQSERTLEGKRSAVDLFENWCASQSKFFLEDIDFEVLENYREFLSRYRIPYSGKLLQRSTQRNRLTAVTVFLRRIFNRYRLANCPSEGFELPKASKRLPKGVLTDEEVYRIFHQVEHFGQYKLRDRAIIEVYWSTSMRRNELANLSLMDISYSEHTIRINHGKNDKDRVVPISQRACRLVKEYVLGERSKLVSFHSGDELFLSNDGRPYKGKQLTALVNHYKRRAGIGLPGACNLFRHTGATRMLERGADIRVIQELLGHADISTTQIYTHVAVTTLKKVYAETHPSNFT